MVAHGVSEPWDRRRSGQAPEGRKKNPGETVILSPLRGLEFSASNPRLAPWAIFCRCSAAKTDFEDTP